MRKLRHHEIDRLSADQLKRFPKHPVVGVLEDIRSIYNVGSIFRSADAARVEKLYLTGITGTPLHRSLNKTALGAQQSVPWEHRESSTQTLQELKSLGYTIVALEITDTPSSVSDLDEEAFPVALLVGHELHGVSDAALELCDRALEIPQYGAKQSLNVSVAFGIAVMQTVQRYRDLESLSHAR